MTVDNNKMDRNIKIKREFDSFLNTTACKFKQTIACCVVNI